MMKFRNFVWCVTVVFLCVPGLFGTSRSFGEDAPATAPAATFHVLAFYNANYDAAHINFVHEANPWFEKMAQQYGFSYDSTRDWQQLNKEKLANVQVVLFLDGAPHGSGERAAFQEYMEHGGGWMGFHVCAFTEKPSEWDWYFSTFLGSGKFHNNTWWPTTAVLKVEAGDHPAMKGLPERFTTAPSEWYSWENDLTKNPDITVLASIDPSSFPVGTDPRQSWYKGYYPILWSNNKFRMIYANFGHNYMDYKANVGKSSTFSSPDQDKFIINSLMWLGSRP